MEEQELVKAGLQKKCPQCGADLIFDPSKGMLFCEYCGYTEEMPKEVEAPKEEDTRKVAHFQKQAADATEELILDEEALEEGANMDWGIQEKTLICKTCGGETIVSNETIAGVCPFCGSNALTSADADGQVMAPGGVVPFKISQDEAALRFKKWMGGKLFAPNDAKKSAKAGAFQGVYLPYWTFDSSVRTDYIGRYGIDKQYKDKDGNTKTRTIWHPTAGVYNTSFDDVLVSGTNRHDTNMIRGVEPFNTGANKKYQKEYLSGYSAERYNIPLKDAWKTAKSIMQGKAKDQTEEYVMEANHADHVELSKVNQFFSKMTYKYLLLPLWFSSFKYNGKIFQFVVNGETGKVYGKSPVSAIKVAIAVAIVVAILVLFFVVCNN